MNSNKKIIRIKKKPDETERIKTVNKCIKKHKIINNLIIMKFINLINIYKSKTKLCLFYRGAFVWNKFQYIKLWFRYWRFRAYQEKSKRISKSIINLIEEKEFYKQDNIKDDFIINEFNKSPKTNKKNKAKKERKRRNKIYLIALFIIKNFIYKYVKKKFKPLKIIKNFIYKYVIKHIQNKNKPLKIIKNFIYKYVIKHIQNKNKALKIIKNFIYKYVKKKFKPLKIIKNFIYIYVKLKRRKKKKYDIRFTKNNEISIQEQKYIIKTINGLFVYSDVFYNMFLNYDFILILKPINKNYTTEKYINFKFIKKNISCSCGFHLELNNNKQKRISFIEYINL